ncbi:MAG: transglycosylase domain-containing protein [Desulfobacteraceae bacterium]|nr:transglycosylase domain-containing protein [Desulfobacterales bacterium]MBL6968062.1 transglycosylase domain-containing protein [Desulfobacteraceae bacterium]MBL7102468.1 transglycosylase domain-containing protein [Desulfobacteraceae bacterium]
MKRVLVIILLLLILVPCAFLGYFYYEVTREAATRIQRGAIDQVISSESPVYYEDGQTPIGVFFEMTHRKYIRYEDIPKIFVKALIAAEDRSFFDHIGFDMKAILRAFVANIRTGRVVQGGSTLTQQTAKNIFKREKRAYKSKLKEMMQAFLLERRYTKEEILEMYTNQFFVTGYGKGLRIAAQYYFGKDTNDLDLVETAFIVGSLKGPNRYNPFIKKTMAERDEAKQLAKARKDYVLANMLKLNFITKDEYTEALERDIPFKEGKITYRLNVVLDYIRNQLESDYFRAILQEQGVDNIAMSGISIYTSVNKEVQYAALMSLRKYLPLMDIELSGYNPWQQIDKWEALLEKKPSETKDNTPFLAEITSVDAGRDVGRLVVVWDGGGGIIDFEGLKPVGAAWLKASLGPWARFGREHVPIFLKKFKAGDLVPVHFATPDKTPSDGKMERKLMLTTIPELEGGVVALHKGMIKAMVGGFFDRYFNRAVHAKRQLGSIFKPIVYAAALQLKWNILDPLKNRRDIFRFQDTSYLPRPDHEPQSDTVSMAWAGAKSENLATVWLLYHLTDHLNMSEFRQVVNLVGLGRGEKESYETYKSRIRDHYGVVVDREAMMEAAFEEAKRQIETDIIFAGHEAILDDLKRLHFDLGDNSSETEKLNDPRILRYDFKRLRLLYAEMREQFQRAIRILRQPGHEKDPQISHRLTETLRRFYRAEDGKGTKIIYTDHPEWLTQIAITPITPKWLVENTKDLNIEKNVWIDGLIPAWTLDAMEAHIRTNYNNFLAHDRYSLEVLSKVRDFKTLVNLSFVVYLSKKIGISTPLDPVLSFPLGPNSISIMEAALAYESLVSGKVYPLSPEGGPAMVPIITKIVDRDGEVIYEYKPEPEIVLPERVSILITEILRKVMEVGTGHKARDAVRVFEIPIPIFGKTGTANRFTNSSFVGLIPGPNVKTSQFDMTDAYVIATYTGFDDNRPMKGKHIAIYGSSGALPLWIDTANAIVGTDDFKKGLQPADLVFNPLLRPVPAQGELQNIEVSSTTGLPTRPSKQVSNPPLGTTVLSETEEHGETRKLKRHFDPF